MTLLRDLFAGPGNAAWDLGRFMAAGSFVSLIAAQTHALIIGQTFDPLEFGGALAALLTGAGALISLKDRAAAKVEGAT